MSLTQWMAAQARAFEPVRARIAALAAAAPVRCLDETGFRVAGRKPLPAAYGRHRSPDPLSGLAKAQRPAQGLGRRRHGITDGLKGYRDLSGVRHALCNAHHLRELKALIEFDGEAWAEPMRDLLLEALRAVEEAQSGPNGPSRSTFRRLRALWELLRLGLARHRKLPRLPRHASNRGRAKRRPGHKSIIRLHRFKDDVLRFLVDFAVPFTNNLAEQALRMMKVKMKISGAFRTLAAGQNSPPSDPSSPPPGTAGTSWNSLTRNPLELAQALSH